MGETPKTIYLKDYKVPPYLIPTIHLCFELFEDHALVTAKMRLQANPQSRETDGEVSLDGENLELLEIKIDDEIADKKNYKVSPHGLQIKNCPAEFSLETKVRIEPQNNKAFSGLYKTKTVFCTQMEAQGFRRTTYFIDRPDVLSRYTTTIRADKTKYPILLSNGNPIEQKDLSPDLHQATWEDPFPKPCYLFALVAGDLDWIEDSFLTRSKRKVDLKIYVDKGKKERARFAMDSLKQSMRWDEDSYRLEYDLDIYNIVAVDDFNMGAMENKGLNIFNSKYVLASPQTATDDEYQAIQRVIGHEYFHNWTGNRVTCRDWFQLSLKEGLTVYRDQEFSSDLNSRPVKRIEDVTTLRSRQFPEDSGPMAHPVRPSSYIAIDNFYTVTVYEKGAEVIRMLHTLLGSDLFKKGVAKYFELFDGQAVTTDDWVHAMELVSGRDLSQFKLWYDQAGTPEIAVHTRYHQDSQTFEIELQQKTVDPITKTENKAYHIPIKVGLLASRGNPIEFSREGKDRQLSEVLELSQVSQKFKMSDVHEKPVLSINREFSAPIQLVYEQTDDELYLLMTKDPDKFNRWESAQKIYRQTLLKNYRSLLRGEPPQVPESLINALSNLILIGHEDPALTARILELPQTHYLAQFITDINPHLLRKAYKDYYQQVARALNPIIHEQYEKLQSRGLGNSGEDIGLRSFKNNLLYFASKDNPSEASHLQYHQFSTATNMTDKISALHCLASEGTAEYFLAMDEFYENWKDDSLVMNKWLTLTALCQSDRCFDLIKEKLKSKTFDNTNPNNVFALLYNFGQYNWMQFHKTDGSTYDWFANQIIDVDKRNPQVASRLASCFNNWRKLSKDFRNPMEKALKKVADSSPSDNVFEIVNRAINFI